MASRSPASRRARRRSAPRLREAAVGAPEAAVRLRARRILVASRRRGVIEGWTQACFSGEIDLEQGALWISRTEYPNESEEDARAQLDEYARILRTRLAQVRTTEGAVHRLVQLLAVELGFTGDDVDYDDADSSYLHRVLESKRGLPIALATIHLCVARRAGVPLLGVGMPQHFILRYETPAGPFFLDPFHDGRCMTRQDCRRFLERNGIFFQESHLTPVTDAEILERMLANLLRVYQLHEDDVRQRRIRRLLDALQTSSASRR